MINCVGSMGLVYLPTFGVFNDLHLPLKTPNVGKYDMDPMGMYGYILDTCRVSGITSQSPDISIPRDFVAFLFKMSCFLFFSNFSGI